MKNKASFPICAAPNDSTLSTRNNDTGFSNICSAGITSFTVNQNGDIYPCHRFYYYKVGETFKLGNIDTGINPARRAYMHEVNNMDLLPTKCRKCNPIIRRKCHICIATNHHVYGGLHKISDTYCLLMKEI